MQILVTGGAGYIGSHTCVELIEAGALFSEEMEQLLKAYLKPMLEAKIDNLVLGCTHYHFLNPILKKICSTLFRMANYFSR